jgi:perosamine synthetase
MSQNKSAAKEVNGETPAPKTITPLHVPEIRGNEWKYLKECLDTGWVSSVGPFVDRFEEELAAFVGTKFAVATVNGTAALHISLLLAGVAPDDEVLVSSLTFIAPANAIRYVGAWPVFIDAEPTYWQMDAEKVVDFLESKCEWRNKALHNRATGRRVKAILPVHILGHPVDLDPILEVARKYNLAVIEDATESLGAKYKGRMVGNIGKIACFSFNGNKIITTGGGGMIATNDEVWARRAKYLTTQAKTDPLEYVHGEIGYNYRLTNLLAAMGCAQMEQLPDYILVKRRIASAYSKSLANIAGITPMDEAAWAYSTFWLFTILVDPKMYGMDSRDLLQRLSEANIQARPLWQPNHRSTVFANCGEYDCPVADQLNREALSLPCSVGITEEDLRRIVEVLALSTSRHART